MSTSPELAPSVRARAVQLLAAHNDRIRIRTDRLFAVLLLTEWLVILVALFAAPSASPQLQVWAAGLGSASVSVPVLLALLAPGRALTRHAVAVAQMLAGAALIHLTAGRIETHFHVFGSLAFLAFYRDWRVLFTATAILATDHIVRGWLAPHSVYGVLDGAQWRWLEHVGWVVFEDLFLGVSCRQVQHEMWQIAVRHAQLEASTLQLERTATASEQLAQRNEQLALEALATTRAKSEFLATMSHEIRTPLNAIINYADLAIRRSERAIPAAGDPAPLRQQRHFASEIRTAGRRLLALINQLLDLSRIEAGRLELHVEATSGVAVLERVRAITGPLAQENHNLLVVSCAPDLQLETDIQRLEQCLINLVGNAAKFTSRGEITLAMGHSPIPGWIRVEVTDTGIGMTPEQLSRLFVPFNQASATTSRRYGGSGLGLAITKSIVALLGGTISVQSERYRGSVFTLELPRVPPGGSAPGYTAGPSSSLRSSAGGLDRPSLSENTHPGAVLVHQQPAASRPTLTFLREFLRHPTQLGAIAPSGVELARLMVESAHIEADDVVVELGAGTGSMTQAILEVRPSGPFVALEPNPALAQVLRSRFPDARIDERPAQQLRAILQDMGEDTADRVISSLPWAAWPQSLQDEIFAAILEVIADDGRLVTFGYVHAQLLPAAKRLRATLNDRFEQVQTTRIAWKNLPPALVFSCERPRRSP